MTTDTKSYTAKQEVLPNEAIKKIELIRQENINNWLGSELSPSGIKKYEEKYKKDSSLFSRLKNGKKTFGERVARRIERDYDLTDGFFDTTEEDRTVVSKGVLLESICKNTDKGQSENILSMTLTDHCLNSILGDKLQQADDKDDSEELNIAIMTVKDNSMFDPNYKESSIKANDIILIDTSYKAFNGDGVYIINNDGKNTIKRIQKITCDGVTISSDNPHIKDKKTTLKEVNELNIIGKLIKKMSFTDIL